ncbi:UNVERIFIED_CONTAM: hypothetical protein K2H54_025549 [Gekko kuhli]
MPFTSWPTCLLCTGHLVIIKGVAAASAIGQRDAGWLQCCQEHMQGGELGKSYLANGGYRDNPQELLRDDVCSALEEVVELEEPSSAKRTPAKEPEKKPVHFRYIEKDLRNLHKDLVHTRRCRRKPVFSGLSALTEINGFCEESKGEYLRMPFGVVVVTVQVADPSFQRAAAEGLAGGLTVEITPHRLADGNDASPQEPPFHCCARFPRD